MKTSFRKFIGKENRHMWSEMAMGTSFNDRMGGLPLNQGLANLLSFAGSMHSNPRMIETIRANILRWVVTEGLAEAVSNRSVLAKMINDKIREMAKEEIPMTQRPGAGQQIPIAQPGLRPAVGESYVYETVKSKRGSNELNYKYHREAPRIPYVHDVDVFSEIARQNIFQELGALARGTNPKKFWEDFDEIWKQRFEPKSIPVRVSGYEGATLSLPQINEVLRKRGFEEFMFGTPAGYMQYVEKGDYLPRSMRYHTDDPNQQHGPDLTRFERLTNKHGEEIIDFHGIGVPDNLVAYTRVLAPMRRNFAALAAGIEDKRISPDQLDAQYQKIASAISGGQFQFADAPEFKSAADASLHTFGLKKGDKKEFPAALIPKLVAAVKAGLQGAFTISPDGLAVMVGGSSHVEPTGKGDRYGQHFKVSPQVQERMFQQIFANVPENVLNGQVDDESLEVEITPRLAWKNTLSSFMDKDSKAAARLQAGQRWELKKVINNAFDINPKLVSPDMVVSLKDRPRPAEFLTKAKEAIHELTPEIMDELSRKGYKVNGQRVLSDLDQMKALIDGPPFDGKMILTKGSDRVQLVNEKGRYVVRTRTSGEEPFKVPHDSSPVSHLLGGVQLGQAQGRGHLDTFPTRHYKDQTKFINQLKSGMYGILDKITDNPDDAASQGHKLPSVVKGVRAARNNATHGKVRGTLITPELLDRELLTADEMVLTYGEEALRALSGHRAMKWGFISDEDFLANKGKKWDVEKDLEKEANKDIDDGTGGKTLKARLFAAMEESPDDADMREFVDDLVQDMDDLVHSGKDITPENLGIADNPELADRIMKAVGENAFWGRVTLIRRYVLNKIMKDINVIVNQNRSKAASQLGSGSEDQDSDFWAPSEEEGEDGEVKRGGTVSRDNAEEDDDSWSYEAGYFRPEAPGELRDIASRVGQLKQQKTAPISGPAQTSPAQQTDDDDELSGFQQFRQQQQTAQAVPPRQATPDMSNLGAYTTPDDDDDELSGFQQFRKNWKNESADLLSYKNWKETYAVFDPKKAKPSKGAGFNWWGTPGNSGGTEIGGEVETTKNDPDGTKGLKHGRKKRTG